jgi:glutaredoxin
MEIPMSALTPDASSARKQECTVRSLYLTGAVYVAGYVAGLVFFAYQRNWIELSLWLLLLPLVKWAYLRFFPQLSKWRGYGPLGDALPVSVSKATVAVTFYSLLGCPFCPIVEHRLKILQKQMDFTLQTVDLTLKPKISEEKNIRSVPVVEVGKDRLVGNATTEQLAQLIGRAAGIPFLAQSATP